MKPIILSLCSGFHAVFEFKCRNASNVLLHDNADYHSKMHLTGYMYSIFIARKLFQGEVLSVYAVMMIINTILWLCNAVSEVCM